MPTVTRLKEFINWLRTQDPAPEKRGKDERFSAFSGQRASASAPSVLCAQLAWRLAAKEGDGLRGSGFRQRAVRAKLTRYLAHDRGDMALVGVRLTC